MLHRTISPERFLAVKPVTGLLGLGHTSGLSLRRHVYIYTQLAVARLNIFPLGLNLSSCLVFLLVITALVCV